MRLFSPRTIYRVLVYCFIATQFIIPLNYAGALDWVADVLAEPPGFDPSNLPPMSAWDVVPPTSNDPINLPRIVQPTYRLAFMSEQTSGCGLLGCVTGDPPVAYVADLDDRSPSGVPARRLTGQTPADLAISAIGNQVAYSQITGNRSEIYLSDSDGRNLRTVTPPDAEDSDFLWSPTENRIVFWRDYGEGDSRTGLYLMQPDGSTDLLVAENVYHFAEREALNWTVWWLPDGSELAFIGYIGSNTEERNIYVVDIVTETVRQITDATDVYAEFSLRWSPDGTQIAFTGSTSPSDPDTSVYSVNVNTTELTLVIDSSSTANLTWGSDSAELSYLADSDTVIFISIETGLEREVNIGAPRDFAPELQYTYRVEAYSISPDGSALAIIFSENWQNSFGPQREHSVYILNLDPSQQDPEPLFVDRMNTMSDSYYQPYIATVPPFWSPDSRYFIYEKGAFSRPAPVLVFIRRSSFYWVEVKRFTSPWTRDVTNITTDNPDDYPTEPMWLPDSRGINFDALVGVNTCEDELCPTYSPAALTQASVGGPVDVQTGTYTLNVTDISMPSRSGQPLAFHRIYSSAAARRGWQSPGLGVGWTHNFDTYLIFHDLEDPEAGSEAGQVVWQAPNGGRIHFETRYTPVMTATPQDPVTLDPYYVPLDGVRARMTREGDTEETYVYVLTLLDQPVRYRFDNEGRVIRITQVADLDENGLIEGEEDELHPLDFEYNDSYGEQTFLTRIQDGEHYLGLRYTDGNLVEVYDHRRATDPGSPSVTYINPNGYLTSVTDLRGETWTYDYGYRYFDGTIDADLLTRVTDPSGVIVEEQTYCDPMDSACSSPAIGAVHGFVKMQSTREGELHFRYIYYQTFGGGRGSLVWVSGEPDGGLPLTEYLFDNNGALTYVRSQVDTNNNWVRRVTVHDFPTYRPVMEIDSKGNFTLYQWSDDSPAPTSVSQSLETSSVLFGALYDANTFWDWLTAGDDETVVYGGPFGISPGSNWDTVTWNYQYEPAIQFNYPVLTRVEDPRFNATIYEYNDAQFPTLPTDVTNALDQQTRLVYHPSTGYLSEVITNFNATAAEQGNRLATRYPFYNAFGQPTEAIFNYEDGSYSSAAPDQDLRTRYVYDAVGRPVLTQDPSGRCDVMVYDPVGNIERTVQNWSGCIPSTNPLPPVDEIVTAANSLVPENDPDPDQNILTIYSYDEAGRLVSVTDALNRTTRFGYDALGRLEIVVENYLDTNGELEDDLFAAEYLAPANNRVTRFTYDGRGNRTGTQTIVGEDNTGVDITRIDYVCYDGVNRPAKQILNLTMADADQWFDGNPSTNPTGDPCLPTYPDPDPFNGPMLDPGQDIVFLTTYDGNGNVSKINFDARSRDAFGTEPWQREDLIQRTETRFLYDTFNRQVASIVNYDNGIHTYNVDPTDRDVINLTYYDRVGNMTATVDPAMAITWMCYDELSRVERAVVNPSRIMLDNQASPDLRPNGLYFGVSENQPQHPCSQTYIESTDPDLDLVSTSVYDSLGRVVLTQDPLERCTLVVYDALGNPTRTVQNWDECDPLADYRSAAWSDLTAAAATTVYTPPDENIITTTQYDVIGRWVQTTDYLDRTRWVCFDALSRPIRDILNGTGPDLCNANIYGEEPYQEGQANDTNILSETAYDAVGNVTRQTDPNENTTRFNYDGLNRMTAIIDPLGNKAGGTPGEHTTTIEYDPLGNTVRVTDPLGNATRFEYDVFGQQLAVFGPRLPSVPLSQRWYDDFGRVDGEKDALGVVTNYEYDLLSRLIRGIENQTIPSPPFTPPANASANIPTRYVYDAASSLIEIHLPNQSMIGYQYDRLYRRITVDGPLDNITDIWETNYDKLGRVTSAVDPRSVIQSFGYDGLGRMDTVSYDVPAPVATTPQVSFTYNDQNRQMTMDTAGLGQTVYHFDALDRITQVEDPLGRSVSYTFDKGGRRRSMTLPGQGTVNYGYDEANRLTDVNDWDPATADVSYDYDNAHRLSTITLPNGIVVSYGYNDDNSLNSIDYRLDGDSLMRLEYELDDVGNRILVREGFTAPDIGPSPTWTPTSTLTSTTTPTPAPCNYTIPDGDIQALVDAINDANSNPDFSAICLADNGTYTLDAPNEGETGLPRILTEIAIVGNGALLERAAESATSFRLLYVDAGASLTLNDLTISGGDASAGGALFNAGSLTINRSTFRDNLAGRGGAIGTTWNSTTTLADSVFRNNTVLGWGGAIDNDEGSLSVTGSVFYRNTAVLGLGGAIASNAETTVTGSCFADDQTGGGQDIAKYDVANIDLIAIGNWWGSASGPSLSEVSGAYADSVSSDVIFSSPLPNAPAFCDTAVQPTPTYTPSATFTPSQTLTPSETPTATNTDTPTATNTATATSTASVTDTATITNTPTATTAPTMTLTPTATTCNFNVAASDVSGLISAINSANSNPNTSTICLTNSTYNVAVSNNSDLAGPTGLPVISTPITILGNGATIRRSGTAAYRIFAVNSTGSLTLVDATVSNGNTTSSGGGIVNLTGSLALIGSTISGNTGNSGGGIYNTGTLTVDSSIVTSNIGTFAGGGIYHADGTLRVVFSTISDNSGDQGGGGVVNESTNPNVTVSYSIITGNTVGKDYATGGGLLAFSPMSATNNCIVGNFTIGGGGGVQSYSEPNTDAAFNWWGTANGPSEAGPGTGDAVSTGVNFLPFRDTPMSFCPDMVTPTPGATATPTASATSTLTATATLTPTATATFTPSSTATPSATNTPTPPSNTATPTATATLTRTPTASSTPTATTTATHTDTPTATSTSTPSPNIHIEIVVPAVDNEIITSINQTGFEAVAYDTGVGTTNGAGISRVLFEIYDIDSQIYAGEEGTPAYCAFGGNIPCALMPAALYSSLQPGTYAIVAQAETTSGGWSEPAVRLFVIPDDSTATPTPSSTATNTATATATDTATNTPTNTATATSTPTDTATPTATFTPSATPIPPLGPGYYEQTEPRITYGGAGGWATVTSTSASGGSYIRSNVLNATIEFQFQGTGVSIYRITGPSTGYGSMEVCLDGVCQTVSNVSAAVAWKQTVFYTDLPDTAHTMTIRNTTAARYVAFDAVQVYGPLETLPVGVYEQTDSRVQAYGNWTLVSNASASGGSYISTLRANDLLLFQFEGNALSLYRTLGSGYGTMEVCIDGTCQTISDAAASTLYQKAATFTGLGAGPHVARVRNTGATTITFDKIEALDLPNLTPLTAGSYEQNDAAIRLMSGWTTVAQASASGGNYAQTNLPGDLAEFAFDGTSFTLYRTIGSGYGSMSVCVDAICYTVSNSASSTLYQQGVTFGGFSPGVHTVRIRNLASTISTLDRVDVASVPSPAALTEGYYEQTDPNLVFAGGPWSKVSSASASGGSYIQSTLTDGSLQFQFDGSGMVLYRTTGPTASYGTMEVCLDGVCQTLSNVSAAVAWKQTVFYTDLPDGFHTVTVRNLENKIVAIDAIQVYDTLQTLPLGSHEQTDSRIQAYGNWTLVSNASASGGSYIQTTRANDLLLFQFEGNAISLYRTLGSGYGTMEVCIDGVCQLVSDAGAALYQKAVSFTGLSAGTHVARVRNTGATIITFDKVDVLNLPDLTPLTAGTYQDNDPNIRYLGSWASINSASASGGSYTRTNIAGDLAEFRFDGTALTLYYTAASGWGTMEVCIDDSCFPVSNNAASTLWQQSVQFGGFAPGVHWVRVRNISTSYVNLDRVDIASVPSPAPLPAGYYEQTDVNIAYGNGAWYPKTSASASGGSYLQTNEQNATITFSFDGTGLTLYRTTGAAASYGAMEVCVDGNCQTVSNVSASTLWKQYAFFTGLPDGVHTVQIRNLDAKALLFDAIRITPQTVPLTEGTYQETHTEIQYFGAWTSIATGSASGGSYTRTNVAGNLIEFQFDGNALTLYRLVASGWGTMEVCIDSQCWNISDNAGSTLYQKPVSFTGLGAGIHAVRIRNTANTYINLDRVDVLNLPDLTPLTAGAYQDNDPNIRYLGSWASVNSASASGGSYTRTNIAGDLAEFRFDGTALTLYYTAASGWGTMEVCVDDSCFPVSNSAASTLWQQSVQFGGFAPGVHWVRVRNISTSYVNLDRVDIVSDAGQAALSAGAYEETDLAITDDTPEPGPAALPPGSYEETDPAIAYTGAWSSYTGPEPSGGSLRYTTDPSATARFAFDGSGVILYFTRRADSGSRVLCLDEQCQLIDTFSPTTSWTQPVAFVGLTPGRHTVELRSISTYYTDLDAVRVMGREAAPPVVTETPTVTATETPTAPVVITITASVTWTPEIVTSTPTSEWTPEATLTATATVTETPTIEASPTLIETPTEPPSATPSETVTETPTMSLTPSATATASETPTDAPTPTDFPTAPPAAVPTPVPSETPQSSALVLMRIEPNAELDKLEDMLPQGEPSLTPSYTPTASPTPTQVNRTIAYQYDNLYRLTVASYCDGLTISRETCLGPMPNPNVTRRYEYEYRDLAGDARDEIIFDGVSTETIAYRYDEAYQLITRQVEAEPWQSFIYDAAGNLTDIERLGATVASYRYDGANRLVSFTDYERSASGTYQYDGVGNRYRQTVNGATTSYLLDLNSSLTQVLGEIRPGDDTYYLLGLDVIGQQTGSQWSYFGYDGLGSVRHITDPTGSLQYAASFAPYGSPFEQFGLGSSLGFTGEQTDLNGLLYLRARYYNPALGAFLSRDPVQGVMGSALSFNPYLYVQGNPINYVDPSGRFLFALFAALPFVVKLGLGVFAAAFAIDTGTQIYSNLQQGMGFGDAIHNVDGWGSLGRAAEWGINVAVGYGTGGILSRLVAKGILTAGRAWLAGAVLDTAWGIGWDMGFHGEVFSTSFQNNILGFGAGELLGAGAKYLGRAWTGVRRVLGWGSIEYNKVDLGTEIGRGGITTFRQHEADAGERLVWEYLEPYGNPKTGDPIRKLQRSPHFGDDWIDDLGTTYDLAGVALTPAGVPVPYTLGAGVRGDGGILWSITEHLRFKTADVIVIDTTNLRPADIAAVVAHTRSVPTTKVHIGLGPGWVNFR
jgi:RHS repeat-associated protein